jgi:hypothetical protein
MADEESLRRKAERHSTSGIESAAAPEKGDGPAHAANKPSSIHAKLGALIEEARSRLRRRR